MVEFTLIMKKKIYFVNTLTANTHNNTVQLFRDSRGREEINERIKQA